MTITASAAKTATISVVSNATVAKLVDAPRAAEIKVAEWLSYTNSNGFDKNSFGARQSWDSKQSLYSFKKKTFPAGFARTIVSRLRKAGYKANWVKRPLPEPLGPKRPVVDDFGYDDPRYSYQPETADNLVRYGQMIASVATGGGKSRIARICYKRISRKTLFLTTRGVLMHQMKDDFEELLSEKVGVLGDGSWTPEKGFNVGMVQTLAENLIEKDFDKELERAVDLEEAAIVRKVEAHKRQLIRKKTSPPTVMLEVKRYREKLLKARPSDTELVTRVKNSVTRHNARRRETIEFLKSVEFLILEEAHEAGSDEYYSVCMACSNAYYRLALTGTAFKRSDEESNMRLMAVSGPIGIKITEKYLIDIGVLATPKFLYIPTPRTKGVYRSTAWKDAYEKGVMRNDWRNDQVIWFCKLLKEYGLTSMVLVLRKEHGHELKLALQRAGLKASFIYGDKNQAERKAALNKLANREIDVLLGTTILDVGVDVPSVGGVCKAGGGKAEIADRQRTGRGLRAKKDGPNICFIADFSDGGNDHLRKHAVARRRIVHETPGFAENVVELDDFKLFDPADYGFKKVS